MGERICVGKLDACCDNAQVRGKAYISSRQVSNFYKAKMALTKCLCLAKEWLGQHINHKMGSCGGTTIPYNIQKGPSSNTKWGDEV